MSENDKLLKLLPSVDRISRTAKIEKLMSSYPRALVLDEIRKVLASLRIDIIEGRPLPDLTLETVIGIIIDRSIDKLNYSIKRAINGTGVILHTSLGRAPFAQKAQEALLNCVKNYCTIQVDQDSGKRGHRDVHVEELLMQITGAEAATVVNNNAAATMLVLNTLAKGKETIVSRGQLVEIGGAFRIPEVMIQSGSILKEVGTTNRTHLKDYKQAIRPNDDLIKTGLILHVHTSNYYIGGFTKSVTIEELAQLAHSKELFLYDDLGSGALVDLSRYGLPKEPTVQESILHGADVVSFSGDKLLGGPQCGIIVGKKEIIDSVRENQLSRSLRCDKMVYAVLEATLRLFLDERNLVNSHPVLKMLSESDEDVQKRAQYICDKLKSANSDVFNVEIKKGVSEVGSGSLAKAEIPTYIIAIKSDNLSSDKIAEKMRAHTPPVFGRISQDSYIIDCRTVMHEELGVVIEALELIFNQKDVAIDM